MHNIYKENGHETRTAYLAALATDYGQSLQLIHTISDTLGSSEDFDALPAFLQDLEAVEVFA